MEVRIEHREVEAVRVEAIVGELLGGAGEGLSEGEQN